MELHDITVTTVQGEAATLAPYADDVVLVVNVASQCGLTPQYTGLEALQRTYGERGFTVLGFPSNDFQQEQGTEAEIAAFCSTTYGVTFPLFAKVHVNEPSQHPLFAALTQVADADGEAGPVAWNFEKFLLTPAGQVHRFRPGVQPDDPAIVALIEASLPR